MFYSYRVIEIQPLHDMERVKLVVSLADDDERVRQVSRTSLYIIIIIIIVIIIIIIMSFINM